MNEFYFILGIILFLLFILDIIWTLLWVEGGAGPVTSSLIKLTWKIMQKLFKNHSKLLSLAGPLTVTLTLLAWIILLWGGWTFIFAGGEPSISASTGNEEITWDKLIYFTGFTVFTLGIGDFVPVNGFWRFLTTLATASGMLAITMSATYLISVLSAVNLKRSFADSVTGLGSSGVSIVKEAWNGRDYRDADLFLNTCSSQLSTITSQHKAYPVLNYYHCSEKEKSLTMAVAILDEALTVYRFGLPKEYQPNNTTLKNARSTVQSYLEIQNTSYIKKVDKAPPVPDLTVLRNNDLPAVSDQEFNEAVLKLEDRRKMLMGIVREDTWTWPSENRD